MKIGNMDKRLRVQKQVLVSDGEGGNEIAWQDVCEIWANIASSSSALSGAMPSPNGMITHEITSRINNNVLTGMRALLGQKILTLRSVVNVDEDNACMKIYAEEELSQ